MEIYYGIYVYILRQIYIYIGSSARFARAEAYRIILRNHIIQDYIMQIYYRIMLRDQITEHGLDGLDKGAPPEQNRRLQNYIAGLYYSIMLRNHITGLCHRLILRDHIME